MCLCILLVCSCFHVLKNKYRFVLGKRMGQYVCLRKPPSTLPEASFWVRSLPKPNRRCATAVYAPHLASPARFNFTVAGKCDTARCPPLVGAYYHASNDTLCASTKCTNTPRVPNTEPRVSFQPRCSIVQLVFLARTNFQFLFLNMHARAQPGTRFRGAWTNRSDACPIDKCNEPPPR